MVLGLGLGASLMLGFVALVLLVYGAEHVVDKMTAVAAYFEIPDVLIGMTVISVGTSLPELVVHVISSAQILATDGCPAVFQNAVLPEGGLHSCAIVSATALGGNIGSDVVQQTLVLGLVVFSFTWFGEENSFTFSPEFLKKDYFPMIGTTLMTLILAWDGILSRADGLVLFAAFLGYMYYLTRTRNERLNHDTAASDAVRRDAFIAVTALSVVLVSAHVLLQVTETIVDATGLGGSIIGVMSIGIASAFPELFTAVEGIRQRAAGLSLGTLIGSNITNPLLAIGS
ncbi:MAG: sodium:calcium antiporter, partial [Candidatus Nanohaloarchaea archaeon]